MKRSLILVLGALLALSACGSASITAEKAEESVARATGSVRAAEKVAEGIPFRLDNRGKGGWEVDIVDNGNVTEVRTVPKGNDVKRHRPTGRIDLSVSNDLAKAKVPLTDAIIKAAGSSKGYVMRAELNRFLDDVVWAVEFDDKKTGVTVRVDAKTGEVVDVDRW